MIASIASIGIHLASSLLVDGSDVVHGRYAPLAGITRDGRPIFVHRVVEGGVATVLDIAQAAPIAAPGSLLRVEGKRNGEHLAVARHRVDGPPLPSIDPAPNAPRTLALLLLDFGADPLPFTIEGTRSAMFEAADGSNAYYAEASFGKESLTGDVYGTYTIPWPGSCDADAIAASAIQAMAADGHDPTAYQQIMYLFPGTADCEFGGLAQVGNPSTPARDSWYNGWFECLVRNQEVGHNYGMLHSHSYDCPAGTSFESCAPVEYGNPYDPLGGGCGHISAHQKHYMGWFDGCNAVSVTANGTFQLLPLELPCDGIQTLRIPTYDGREYFLEYRQPLGFDVGNSGVLVNVSNAFDYYGPDGYLLTGAGTGGFLGVGDGYTDPQGLVTFTVAEMHETHATIEVTFADGGAGDPSCGGGGQPEMLADAWGVLACAGGPFQGDMEPPSVVISTPTDGQQFDPGASFEIEVEADDDVMVAHVSLWLDGVLQSTATAPPWRWPVEDAPVGVYEIYAIADDGIHETQSAIVTFEVREPPATTGAGATDGGTDGSGGGGDGGEVGSGAPGTGDGWTPTGESEGDSALPPGFGATDDAGGCGCTTEPTPTTAWLVGLLGLAGGRRRRA